MNLQRERQLSFHLLHFFGQILDKSLTATYTVRIIKVQNTVQKRRNVHVGRELYEFTRKHEKLYG